MSIRPARNLFIVAASIALVLSFCIMTIAPALLGDVPPVMAHPCVPEDGCTPEPDGDGDGTTDDLDACPGEAGVPWNSGCPESYMQNYIDQQQQPAAVVAQPTAIPPTNTPNPITARAFPTSDADAIRAALENGAVSLDDPVTLANFAGGATDIISELQGMEEIPAGGILRLELPFMFLSGRGDLFLGLASGAPSQNLVMGATMTFTANALDDQTLEVCSLSARVERDNNRNAQTLLDFALVNNGGLAVIDRSVAGGDSVVTALNLRLDVTQPHHLLAVVQDSLVDVYIDGERVIDDLEVTPRAGTYGLSLVGRGSVNMPRCEARDYWLYTYE